MIQGALAWCKVHRSSFDIVFMTVCAEDMWHRQKCWPRLSSHHASAHRFWMRVFNCSGKDISVICIFLSKCCDAWTFSFISFCYRCVWTVGVGGGGWGVALGPWYNHWINKHTLFSAFHQQSSIASEMASAVGQCISQGSTILVACKVWLQICCLHYKI